MSACGINELRASGLALRLGAFGCGKIGDQPMLECGVEALAKLSEDASDHSSYIQESERTVEGLLPRLVRKFKNDFPRMSR
jgi:hypothetical protein